MEQFSATSSIPLDSGKDAEECKNFVIELYNFEEETNGLTSCENSEISIETRTKKAYCKTSNEFKIHVFKTEEGTSILQAHPK